MGPSSSSCSLNIFFFLVIMSVLIEPGQSDDVLIEKTCKNTKYFDLCVSGLRSDPASSGLDLKGLATIMVNLGIANATDTYSYLSAKLSTGTSADGGGGSGGGGGVLKKVFRLCAVKYSYATDSLKSSIQDLSDENYDYAAMHVTAAADYPNSCRNAFGRNPGLGYPAELRAREDGLKRICAVVLGILDQIYSTDHDHHHGN